MSGANRIGLVLALASGVACATSAGRPAAQHDDAVAVDVRPYLAKLQAVSASSGGDRPIAQLDITGDGKVDADDRAVFSTVEQAARRALADAGVSVGTAVKLYEGPAKDAPVIFGLVGVGDAGLDLSAIPVERIEELAVESRWAEEQTRFGIMFGGDLQGTVGGALVDLLAGYNSDRMEPEAVCAALQSLDIAKLTEAGVRPTAIFDIDSTIWAGNVTDVFLASLAELNVSKPETNTKLQAFLKTIGGVDAAAVDAGSVADNARLMLERATNRDLPKDNRVSPKDAFYNIVGLISGLTLAEAHAVAKHAMEQGAGVYPPWKEQVYGDRSGCGMRRIIDLLNERGVEVYLLSATLDLLAKIAGDYLGVPSERIIGSVLEVDNGVYTGEVKDSTYYTKGAITRQWLPSPPLFAFGDSPTSDFSMLQEAVGPAFMINARDRFLLRDKQEAGARLVTVSFDGTEHDLAAE